MIGVVLSREETVSVPVGIDEAVNTENEADAEIVLSAVSEREINALGVALLEAYADAVLSCVKKVLRDGISV